LVIGPSGAELSNFSEQFLEPIMPANPLPAAKLPLDGKLDEAGKIDPLYAVYRARIINEANTCQPQMYIRRLIDNYFLKPSVIAFPSFGSGICENSKSASVFSQIPLRD
jgi:hypothetical protein